MIDWLRQAGHSHLLDERIQNTNSISSPPPPSIPFGQPTSSSNYPPQATSLSSVSPPFNTGFPGAPPMNTLNRTASFPQTDFNPTASYGGGAAAFSPPIGSSSFGQHQSPLHFNAPSPTQLLAPNRNERQLDIDIEVKYFMIIKLF
jgi:hypothetical protein